MTPLVDKLRQTLRGAIKAGVLTVEWSRQIEWPRDKVRRACIVVTARPSRPCLAAINRLVRDCPGISFFALIRIMA